MNKVRERGGKCEEREGEQENPRGWGRRGNELNIRVHFSLLHQLHALRQPRAHLGQLLFHLLDLRVRGELLRRGDLSMS